MASASFIVYGSNIDELVGQAEHHLEQLLDLNREETKRRGVDVRSYKYTLSGICPAVRKHDGGPAGLWEATADAHLTGWGIPE